MARSLATGDRNNGVNDGLSVEDRILEELARLELARRRLTHYAQYAYPGYKESRHQKYIIEALEEVEKYIRTEGKEGCGRLIINIPPGHGKTLTCSILFPSWMMGRNPDKRVILASYGAQLAERNSRDVRNLMEDVEYQKVFGAKKALRPGDTTVQVDPEGRAVQTWEVKGHKGGLMAAGVGGPILGYRAHLAVIDDPHKGRAEADSEVERQNVWDWYTSVLMTRMEKGGAVVIIMQRWHEDDLVGRLMALQPEKWKHISLPAICVDTDDALKRVEGEALWPEKFDLAFLNDFKQTQSPRDWNSMYQQTPTATDGDVFQSGWFVYDDLPEKHDISYAVQVWDTAMTEKQEGDYSACVTMFVTRYGTYVADVYRARLTFPELKARMFDHYSFWNKYFRISRICIENKVSGMSVIQSLKKEAPYLPVIPMEPDSKLGKSKLLRAQSVSGYVQAGRVVFRKNAPWLHEFEHELLSFPRGKHDDMVDAFVYGLIQVQGGARAPRKTLDEMKEKMNFNRLDRHSALLGGW